MMFLPAVIYLFIFLFLIYKNDFFGLLTDTKISAKELALFFLFKCIAIPTFLIVYQSKYGGIEKLDAGVFYRDAVAVYNICWMNFGEFLRVLFGLQDDSPGSYFYNHAIIYTQNWDNGQLKDFFYNDNRIVIRLHAILHFIAFNSYAVHALFSCFLSFLGCFFLYKGLKEYFFEKELSLFLILCFFPALWFFTGAVLKEGLVIFVMGNAIYQLKKLFNGKIKFFSLIWLILLIAVSTLLKPYLLCFSIVCFSIFFMLNRSVSIKYKTICFLLIMGILLVVTNVFFIQLKHKNMKELALTQQRIFSDAAQGGIFLLDDIKFVRLIDDTTLITKRDSAKIYSIKKNVPYIYWEHHHQKDTLYCESNQDTLSQYKLVYRISKGGSNIDFSGYSKNNFLFVLAAFGYSLFYPFFYNAHGTLQMAASIENLLILISLIVIISGLFAMKRERLLPLVLVFIALSLCLLIGITTPNSGAIFRYRSPAVIFMLIAALYCIKPTLLPFKRKWN